MLMKCVDSATSALSYPHLRFGVYPQARPARFPRSVFCQAGRMRRVQPPRQRWLRLGRGEGALEQCPQVSMTSA